MSVDWNEGAVLGTARVGDQADFARLAEPYRRELQVHCYRMLGSILDAQDMAQETLFRAWRKLDTFEGRASFRAWLYKIATNLCLDALDRRPRRALPQTRQASSDSHSPPQAPILEPIWLEPIPDDLAAGLEASPEAHYEARESISLAFLAALQALPPRQRAILILRDVLDWSAEETARLLDLSLPAVNSGLYRARVTLAKRYHRRPVESLPLTGADQQTRALLERFVNAWQAADIDGLVSLLKEDATFPMPPLPQWYVGRAAIRDLVAARILNGDARGRWRLVPTRANGQAAFAWYEREETGNTFRAFAIQVVTVEGNLISDVTTFANPRLFAPFGLPGQLEA